MESHIRWIDTRLAVCDLAGEATPDGLEAIIDELIAHPNSDAGMSLLADGRKLDVSKLSASDIQEAVEWGSRLLGRKLVQVALIVGSESPSRYGIARMIQAYVNSLSSWGTMEIFATRKDAALWIDRNRERVAVPVR